MIENKIDYKYLVDDAKINLSTQLNKKMNEYKKNPNKELKKDILQLMKDRQNIFLFDINTIIKYLN